MKTENNSLESDAMTKEEILAELTANDIPQKLREKIVDEWQQENSDQKIVADLEKEHDDALKLIGTLQGQVEGYQSQEFDAALDGQVAELVDWQVKDEEAKKKVDAFKGTVRTQILSKLNGDHDAESIEKIAGEVWEEMKPLAEMIRDALSGPPAVVSSKVRNSIKLEDTAETRARARAATGI
jgi:hypothetical protein